MVRRERSRVALRIGSVAALTGLAPHTLRSWERRYGLVQPRRGRGGERLYGPEQVERLRLLKALATRGERLGLLATLCDEQLRVRVAEQTAFSAGPSRAAAGPSGTPPPRVFDDRQLARLLEVTSSIPCECPNHLSSIVARLVAFEVYSRDCESRDDADAALHGRLARETAAARSRLEGLLLEVCRHDGIDLGGLPHRGGRRKGRAPGV